MDAALRPLELRPRTSWEAAWAATGATAELAALSTENASFGLSGVDAKQATILLKDLLLYPVHSTACRPKIKANLDWSKRVAELSLELSKRPPPPSAGGLQRAGWDVQTLEPEGASPYLKGFVSERIAALGRLGADPVAARPLLRAVFRKNREEAQAALSIPGCPRPGYSWSNSGGALHRACYAGPNDIFCVIARASQPADWIIPDDQGRLPIDLAQLMGNQGRTLAASLLTPFAQAPRDANGQGPLHRLANNLEMRSLNTDPKARAWAKSFQRVAEDFGSDLVFQPDANGHSPLDLARAPALRDALLRAHAASSAVELDLVSTKNVKPPTTSPRL